MGASLLPCFLAALGVDVLSGLSDVRLPEVLRGVETEEGRPFPFPLAVLPEWSALPGVSTSVGPFFFLPPLTCFAFDTGCLLRGGGGGGGVTDRLPLESSGRGPTLLLVPGTGDTMLSSAKVWDAIVLLPAATWEDACESTVVSTRRDVKAKVLGKWGKNSIVLPPNLHASSCLHCWTTLPAGRVPRILLPLRLRHLKEAVGCGKSQLIVRGETQRAQLP